MKVFLLSLAVSAMLLFWKSTGGEITVFLVGDSTMADKPYTGSNPEKGWGQVFPLYFKEGVRFENHAMNGRSTKSFRAEGRWDTVMERLKAGDYVIIEFGHNDQKINSADRYAFADSTYRDNLTRFVDEVRAKGGKPVLATPISRRSFDENGNLTDTHGRYSEVVREVATQLDVPIFDLHGKTVAVIEQFGVEKSKELFLHFKPGDYDKFPKGVEDNTHLSPTGAFKVADLAVEELKRELPELVPYLKP
ncbi:rhamnogalacturonan acetylesterase [Algoriphagus aestuariicola]|jgi:lysophospholipase L1-like esterase|uniref:Rhamnogalacturonan acetylesterase n=1 Tax=Algoriphagus aestuariicola TaxID=1852016 RepID=A0ABS3BVZ5_9BACT|nr:rhamnogalacturonan acetylesterase [Algoriphagus aestuariicola]MBN7803056.1 rhamnogalacturonan acetylesterase [Algoriphagus aestuariicola]